MNPISRRRKTSDLAVRPARQRQNHPTAARVIGVSFVQWLLALGVIWFISVALLPDNVASIFWHLLKLYDLTGAWAGVFVLALSWVAAPYFARCDWARVAAWVEHHLVALCALGFVFYAALAFWAYHHHPLTMDEYAPLLESRTFVAGQLRAWVPPHLLSWVVAPQYRGEFLQVTRDSGFYSPTYWPGLAILEMPFVALGAPWLCNPTLGALALWGVHRLTLRLTRSPEAAAWAWVLMLSSPAIALNAASFYSMPAHLLFNVAYCLLLLRDDRRGALGAGIVGGFALVLHNPVPHTAFALPWIVFVAWKRRRLLAPLLLGYLVFALPLGLGWSRFLDGFDASSYVASNRAARALPFAEMLSRLATVVAWPNALLTLSRAAGVAKTVVWAVPGLTALAWYGWRALPKPRPNDTANDAASDAVDARGLRLLAASFLTTFLIYCLVKFDQGHGWGFRYLHSAWFAMPILGSFFLARASEKSAAPHNRAAHYSANCVAPIFRGAVHRFAASSRCRCARFKSKIF